MIETAPLLDDLSCLEELRDPIGSKHRLGKVSGLSPGRYPPTGGQSTVLVPSEQLVGGDAENELDTPRGQGSEQNGVCANFELPHRLFDLVAIHVHRPAKGMRRTRGAYLALVLSDGTADELVYRFLSAPPADRRRRYGRMNLHSAGVDADRTNATAQLHGVVTLAQRQKADRPTERARAQLDCRALNLPPAPLDPAEPQGHQRRKDSGEE